MYHHSAYLKLTHDTYSIERDIAELKELDTQIENFKEGKINEEELQQTKIKIDRIMRKYNTNDVNDKLEKAEEMQNHNYEDEEYYDEENQNSMIKAYVNEKIEEAYSNDIENNGFDEFLIEIVKKLNILKLFTMEAKVDVRLAAVL